MRTFGEKTIVIILSQMIGYSSDSGIRYGIFHIVGNSFLK